VLLRIQDSGATLAAVDFAFSYGVHAPGWRHTRVKPRRTQLPASALRGAAGARSLACVAECWVRSRFPDQPPRSGPEPAVRSHFRGWRVSLQTAACQIGGHKPTSGSNPAEVLGRLWEASTSHHSRLRGNVNQAATSILIFRNRLQRPQQKLRRCPFTTPSKIMLLGSGWVLE
jgi:hypothetical protein